MAGKRKHITWISDENDCHICTSHALDVDGYPCLSVKNRKHHMHRVLYEEKYGSLGDLVARHKCDNRACINIDHIESGAQSDNCNDTKIRGRLNPLRGECRSDAKLTDSEVAEIRISNRSQSKLASQYGVNQSTISRIKSGEKRKLIQ